MIIIIITVHRTIIKSHQSIFWNIPVGVFVNFMRQCALGHIFLDTEFTSGYRYSCFYSGINSGIDFDKNDND